MYGKLINKERKIAALVDKDATVQSNIDKILGCMKRGGVE